MAEHSDREARSQEQPQLKLRDWGAILKETLSEARADGVPRLAAGLTYYALLSLFPALIVLVTLLALIGRASTVSFALDFVGQIGPPSAVDAVRGSVERLVAERSAAGGLLSLGIVLAIWSASNYVGAFMWSVNQMYEVEGRPFLRRIPRQVLLALGILVLLAVILVAFVLSEPVAQTIGDTVGLGSASVLAWRIARWPALFLAATMLFSLLYHYAPNVRHGHFRWITPGGVLGVALWLAASYLFGLFVRYFANYGATYGALAGIVVFLFWLWLFNIALLGGAEMNERREAALRHARGVAAVTARRVRSDEGPASRQEGDEAAAPRQEREEGAASRQEREEGAA